ncbi:uncharacterized protein LOC134764235 [Penaeus indicus]|uniref:uncharacterized protein LOC134764235 n=1 Tax=Penaeus indicus TaxID=29960 RepID=UPI00300CFABB
MTKEKEERKEEKEKEEERREMEGDFEVMDCQSQEDYGAYLQSPILYFLRNVCGPALARLFVKIFKKSKYVTDRVNVNGKTSPNTNDQIMDMNLYELLRKVHNKGKRIEEKKKNKANDSQNSSVLKTLHLNNLGTNADILGRVMVKDLLDDNPNQSKIEWDLSQIDVTFLLNVLTNEVLGCDLDLDPLQVMKSIRNKVFHSGSGTDCTDINLDKLCEAAKKLYEYLGESVDIDAKREESLRFSQRLDKLAVHIIDDLRKEITLKYENPDHAVLLSVIDTGCQSKVKSMHEYIKDLGRIPNSQRNPIMMCGASGSGKSSILQSVASSMCREEESPFKLVLYLKLYSDPCETFIWEGMLKCITEQYPKLVEKYDIALILDALRMYANEILFLVDWNIKHADFIPLASMVNGAWVVTYQGECESSSAFRMLQLKPLTEDLVQNILKSLNENEGEVKYMLKLFEECKYKGILDTPEMVKIFNEVRKPVPCKEMLEYFIKKKIGSIEADDDLELIEELAFNKIMKNEGFYKKEELTSVKPEIQDSFFLKDAKGLSFRYRVIEDLFASRYVRRNEEKAETMFKEYPSQIPMLKRIIRFTCTFWCQNNMIGSKVSFIKPYLYKVLNVEAKLGKKKSARKQNANDSETCRYESAFTKWSYLVNFVEACGHRQEILDLIAEIIAQKYVWLFKCKFLNEEKVPVIKQILENVKYKRRVMVRLESGMKCEVLNSLLNVLGNLPLKNEKMSVQINIVGSKYVTPSSFENLSRDIVKIRNPHLELCKYVGPFVYKGEEDFLKCLCVKDNLQSLDVTVRDVESFAEIINCDGQTKLKDSTVRVNLKSVKGNPKSPILSEHKPPNLKVQYQDGILDLLCKFGCSKYLKYLTMDRVVIRKNFHMDLKAFTSLECLFIKCDPEYHIRRQRNSTGTEPMVVDGVKDDASAPVPMAVDEVKDDASAPVPMAVDEVKDVASVPVPMAVDEVKDDAIAPVVPLEQWGFKLVVETELPQGLERLMLRNMIFCNDSNVSVLLEKWKNLQRLTILDTIVSVTGAYNIIKMKNQSQESTSSGNSSDNIVQEVKKKCNISTSDTSREKECPKCPRLTKDERTAREKKKPTGRELIITSIRGLCRKCSNFPCSCKLIEGQDMKDTFDSIINLIKAAYNCDYLSFSYTNKIFTVRKNMHKDLRVNIPLSSLNDDTVCNLQEYPGLNGLFEALNIAQYIQLENTKLSHNGAEEVAKLLIKLKESHGEPFSLVIFSAVHPKSAAEVRNSKFIKYLRSETKLTYFYFQCLCKKRCHTVKKTHNCNILINDEIIKR